MQVVVDRLESTSDLHAHLSPTIMSRLQIDEEDVIKIASPARKFIIVAVTSKGFHGADNNICIGRNFRQLLECYLGETVTIEPFKYCQQATKVVFAPISDTMNSIAGNFLNVIKNSNYDFTNIPVWKDMVIPIYALQHIFEFRVVECQPITAVIVTDPDIIQCQNEAVERVKSPVFDKICYDDVGGIDSQLLTIRKLVENPRTSSALIVAPSGCGKTFLSQAIRNETKSHFEFISAIQLLGFKYDKCKALLSKVLEATAQNTPAIVYIDDIDSIAAIQNYDGEEPDDRLINSFSDFIDRLRKMPNVLTLATSKTIDDLRSDFHPPTCFNEAIKIDIPTKAERAAILRAITRKMTLTSSNAIDDMASMTEGQTPSDLLLICKRTILSHINEILSNFDLNNPYIRLDDLHDVAVGQGVYSSSSAASRNKKKKNKAKDGSKKQSRINNLDPFGDLLSQQDNDNSNSDDDDNDNDNDDENYMFPVNSGNNNNSNRGSLNPFNTTNMQQDDKNDNDAMFGFGISPQKDLNNGNGSTTDIFGQAPTVQSNDPFANSKSSDPFSLPGVGSATGFPMNDPFSTPGGNGTSSTAAAAAAAVAGGVFGMGNQYNNQGGSSGHHKKRDGDEKKHKKHKKHNKSKRDDAQQQQQQQQIPQNPFNTAAQMSMNNGSSSALNNDPFSHPKQSAQTSSVDPFAFPASQKASSNNDPFGQVKSSNSKSSVDPFSDPFASSQPSPSQKRQMSSQNSDPFAAEGSKSRPTNEDPFSNLAAMPRNSNRAQNSDPFAPAGSGNKELSSNASDPFAPVLKRGGRTSDPFAPSSVRNKSARESIDPFAPPSKK